MALYSVILKLFSYLASLLSVVYIVKSGVHSGGSKMSGSGSTPTKPVPSVPPKSHCKSGWISSESTGSREDVFVVRTSKTVENL